MKKIIVKTKESLFNDEHILKCCLCGDNNRVNLLVEDIGIAVGISGENYSFCKKCWYSKDLGKEILKLVGYPDGMKILDEQVEVINDK